MPEQVPPGEEIRRYCQLAGAEAYRGGAAYSLLYVAAVVLLVLQIGVGDQIDTNQLRAIASANQLYTVLVESNFTSLTDALTSKLVDILCNSQHSRILKKCIFFLRLFFT